jgi:uncharacterized protein YneR
MKITKILVALSFLFAVATANAGEMTVTGSMQATYQSEVDKTTGNPLGMDREIKFAGSTELDNGISMSVMQDFDDAGAFGDAKITFGNVGGLLDIYVGTDGSELDAIDDITPTAFEEANGAGSGTYKDVGGLAAEMGIGFKASLPIVGTVSGQYIPKVDGSESGDKTASGDTSASVGSGMELVVKTAMGDLPVVGSFLGNNTLTLGYAEDEVSTIANTSDRFEATVAITGSYGNFSYGFQREHIDEGQATAATTDADFFRVDSIGLAYAVNDALSISYNIMEQKAHNIDADNSFEQETDAINIGYTVGGITLGFQDASTDNANMVKDVKDDTRTISVKAAF